MSVHVPRTTHTWLQALYNFLDNILSTISGGNPDFTVDLVATSALSACTYANGTGGIGATLTGNANGAMDTIDSVAPALNKTYLVAGQASGLQNGLYKLTQLGDGSNPFILTRLTTCDQSAEFNQGNVIGVRAGTINAGTQWEQTSADAPTMGTTAITFARSVGNVTTNTNQTISGIKSFAAGCLKVFNAGGTFASLFASSATAARTVTLPDASFTVAQAAVASGSGTAAITVADQVLAKSVSFKAPIAEELVAIVAAVTPTNVALTVASQPDYPRALTVRVVIDTTHAITAGVLTIIGIGASGEAVTEAVSLIRASSATLYTSHAFAHVTSATVSAIAITGGAGSTTVGVGNSSRLGLPGSKTPAGGAFAVYKANVNQANEAVGTVDATYGTIIPTTAPDGSKNFDFFYNCTITPTATDGGHTHVQS